MSEEQVKSEGGAPKDECECPPPEKIECPPPPKVECPPPEKDECPNEYKLNTCAYDPRFPNQNQTKRCYLSFVDYQRCARLLGDYPGCLYFLKCYKCLCPRAWYERWYEQMEKGTFPRKIYPPKPIIKPKSDRPMLDACAPDLEEEPPPSNVC